MSQFNHPLAPAVIPNLQIHKVHSQQVPAAKTSSFNGTAVDLLYAGQEQMFAVLHVGAVTGTNPTLDVTIEESSDNSTFTAVSGAVFTQVTASTNLQMLTFTRTKRYVRVAAVIAGTTPSFTMAALLGT